MPANLHATVFVAADRGILVRGAAGTGKTTLALTMLATLSAAGRHGALVSDDQVLVSVRDGRLVAAAPPSILGLVEVRGRSPQRIDGIASAVLDLVVDLDPAAPRYADDGTVEIEGCAVPVLRLPERNATAACIAIGSWLRLNPFA